MPRSALRFLIHQLLSTEGVIVACAWLTYTIWSYTSGWNSAWQATKPSWLLTEVPMFPLQTITSLLLGFILWRRLRHTTMFWVWILPCLILFVVFCATSESHQAPLAYFFGSGCILQNHCFTQVAVTLPALTSVAYAAGAVLARAIVCKRVSEGPSRDPVLRIS